MSLNQNWKPFRMSSEQRALAADQHPNNGVRAGDARLGWIHVGANGLDGNSIRNNVPSGDTAFTGGVVMLPGDFGTLPTDISFHGNHMGGNSQDFVTLGPGSNVKISGNH